MKDSSRQLPMPRLVATFVAYWGFTLLVIGLFLCLLLGGCTLAPDPTAEGYPIYDSSTPVSYLPSTHDGFDSGILPGKATFEGKPMIRITTKRAAGDNAAIPWVDEKGNHIFLLPPDDIARSYDAAIDAQKTKLENAR